MTSTAGRILGNYQLGEPIGRGGASEVFAGVHRFLGHEVAVKLLRADLPGGEPEKSSIDAFLGEAARARAVHHPNLVSVLDFGRDDATGRCYLVMERIPGESLAERLRRIGRLAEPDVRALGAALADAMQAAHDGGIVHRDLKPANVMLRGDQPTVVDFGLARDLGGQSALETGRRVGTPAYMAPEQLTGGLIAPCVDIWALGVILFETLTGKLPFEGFADGRCPQLFESAPRVASLVHVTPDLDALVARCLDRSPGRRPPTMASVARALQGEGEERVTQDVAEPAMSGMPGLAAGTGDLAARVGDPAAGVGDPAAGSGDPAARVGDPAATSPMASLAPANPATRSGAFVLRPRHWSLVVLAAAAASFAAVVTVRLVGGAGADGAAPPVSAAEDGLPPTAVGEGTAPETPSRGVDVGTVADDDEASRRAPADLGASSAAGAPSTAEVRGQGSAGPSAVPEGSVGTAIPSSPAVRPSGGVPERPDGIAVPERPDGAAVPERPDGAAVRSSPLGSPPSRTAPSSPGAATTAAAASLALDIRSTPSGADVLVAGKRRGRTPLHLELSGPGRVVLRKRGYRPAAVRVERAGLLDVHLTRRGRSRAAAQRPAKKQPDPPRGEGLD